LRAVLDPAVLIAALLAQRWLARRAFQAWLEGMYELIVSISLLAELDRLLAYPKLRRRISSENAEALSDLLRRTATLVNDPATSSTGRRSRAQTAASRRRQAGATVAAGARISPAKLCASSRRPP
jgi:predicted nucleic acid-binding protein